MKPLRQIENDSYPTGAISPADKTAIVHAGSCPPVSTYDDLVQQHPALALHISSAVWNSFTSGQQREWALGQAERLGQLLADAARAIPNVAGPVEHRVKMLRLYFSEEIRVLELAIEIMSTSRNDLTPGIAIARARKKLSGRQGSEAKPADSEHV